MWLTATAVDFGAITEPMADVAGEVIPSMTSALGAVGPIALIFMALLALAVVVGLLLKFTNR